jgi:Uma2 family endonuclease
MCTISAPSPVTLLSAEEFVKRHENERVELVQGVVKELPRPSLKHGKVCATIARFLGNYADERDVGHVISNDSFVKTTEDPDSVRGPDVCYFSYERLPKGAIPEGLLPLLPDLVVEGRSPSDHWTDVFAKVVEYLKAGVRVVILLDSGTQTASVYRPEDLQQIFHNGDELVVPEVLPGFAVPVRRLFE